MVHGRVSPKNHTAITDVDGYLIEKKSAGRGFMHVVSPKQLRDFIELIPDWDKLSHRLESITLAAGSYDNFGLYYPDVRKNTGRITIYPWQKNLWGPVSGTFFDSHRHVLDALGVGYLVDRRPIECNFSVAQARAFSLLHVFMHEVGHHRDFLRRRGLWLSGTEEFAEDFADDYFDRLLPRYVQRFGDPSSRQTENVPAE